jgi:hypothetical protein
MNNALRTAITAITEGHSVEEHARRLGELHVHIPHTIRVLESEAPLGAYTCVVHAFYLVGDPTYEGVASFGLGKTFAGKDFVESLVRAGKLASVQEHEARPDDFVIYFNEEDFCHIGRLRAPGRIASKWGTGLLVEHAVWEVPASYGQRVAFYRGLTADQSFEAFLQYARDRGFSFGAE